MWDVPLGPVAVFHHALLRDDALLLLDDALGLEIGFAEVLGSGLVVHASGRRTGRATTPGTALAPGPGMEKTPPQDIPRNEQDQPPTRGAKETEQRLEEKERADRGQANKDRIEAKISGLKR